MSETQEKPLIAGEREFVYDAQQKYSCTDCPARCCRFPWKIDVTVADRERMLAVPWIADVLKQNDTDFLPVEDAYKLPRIKRPWGDYSCPFLGEDDRCTIHAKEGPDMLPTTCRTYPFSRYVAEPPEPGESGPTKIYPMTSFFCRSLSYNYGTPVADLLSEKFEDYLRDGVLLYFPDSIELGGFALPKKSYMALGDCFEKLFARADWTVPQILWQGRQLLNRMIVAGYEYRELSEEVIGRVASEFLEKSDAEMPVAPPHTLAGRTVVAIELMPYLLFELLKKFPKNTKSPGEFVLLKLLLGLIGNKGTYDVWNLERPIDFAQANKVTLDEYDPEFQKILREYYHGLFARKGVFMSDPDFLRTYFYLGSSYAQILKMARWMAYSRGSDSVNRADLLDAAGYVDIRVSSARRTDKNLSLKLKEAIITLLSAKPESFARVMLSESY